jgi:hypothetical protein
MEAASLMTLAQSLAIATQLRIHINEGSETITILSRSMEQIIHLPYIIFNINVKKNGSFEIKKNLNTLRNNQNFKYKYVSKDVRNLFSPLSIEQYK